MPASPGIRTSMTFGGGGGSFTFWFVPACSGLGGGCAGGCCGRGVGGGGRCVAGVGGGGPPAPPATTAAAIHIMLRQNRPFRKVFTNQSPDRAEVGLPSYCATNQRSCLVARSAQVGISGASNGPARPE